jgi:hypothetical protein
VFDLEESTAVQTKVEVSLQRFGVVTTVQDNLSHSHKLLHKLLVPLFSTSPPGLDLNEEPAASFDPTLYSDTSSDTNFPLVIIR